MSDDFIIEVRVKGVVDSSLASTASEVKATVGTVGDQSTAMASAASGAFKAIGDGLETSVSAWHAFKAGVAIAGEALEQTAGKAEEFSLTNAKFADQIGSTGEVAAGLSAALKGVGSSTDEYTAMSGNLDRQVETNEKSMNALGITTRDANGQLLSGKAAMDSAIAAMGEYKAGTDQNQFALKVFGRSAADVHDIMRATQAVQDQYTQDMRDLGVATGKDAAEGAAKLEEALARQKQQFEDVKIAIGQHLMPIVTSFVEGLNEYAKPALKEFEEFLKGVAVTTMEISALIAAGFRVVEGAAREATDIAIGLGEAMFQASQGNYSAAAKAASTAWQHMKDDASNTSGDIKAIMQSLDADIQQFELGVAGAGKPGGGDPPHGNKTFVDPNAGKQAAEEARRTADELAQIDQQSQLKHIEAESRTNDFLLSMGERSLDEFKAQAIELENDRFGIEQKGQARRENEDKGNNAALAIDQAEGRALEKENTDRLIAIDEDYRRKKKAADEAALQDFIKQEQAKLAQGIAADEALFKAGVINEQQRHELEVALTESIEKEVIDRFDAEHKGLVAGTKAYEDAQKQKNAIIAGFAHTVTDTDNRLFDAEAEKWKELVSSIRSSFNSALDGLIFQGNTLKQFFANVAKGIAEAFLAMGEKIVEDWVEQEIRTLFVTQTTEAQKIAAVEAGGQAQVAVMTTTTAEGQAVSVAAGSTQILNDAYKAAAGAYNAVVGIPVIGPVLAPIAAGVAFAAVSAYDQLTSAEGGLERVDSAEKLMITHRDESVLPARISRPLMSFVSDLPAMADVVLRGGAAKPNQSLLTEIGQIASAQSPGDLPAMTDVALRGGAEPSPSTFAEIGRIASTQSHGDLPAMTDVVLRGGAEPSQSTLAEIGQMASALPPSDLSPLAESIQQNKADALGLRAPLSDLSRLASDAGAYAAVGAPSLRSIADVGSLLPAANPVGAFPAISSIARRSDLSGAEVGPLLPVSSPGASVRGASRAQAPQSDADYVASRVGGEGRVSASAPQAPVKARGGDIHIHAWDASSMNQFFRKPSNRRTMDQISKDRVRAGFLSG